MFRQDAYQVFLSTNGKNDRSCALDTSPVMLSDRPPLACLPCSSELDDAAR